ncbi:MAG: hypothetical protein HRU19_00785 [Pseudobacteriovorax sp.]|nr:hypothetical protein [Pseudobacteriovorax sp.]
MRIFYLITLLTLGSTAKSDTITNLRYAITAAQERVDKAKSYIRNADSEILRRNNETLDLKFQTSLKNSEAASQKLEFDSLTKENDLIVEDIEGNLGPKIQKQNKEIALLNYQVKNLNGTYNKFVAIDELGKDIDRLSIQLNEKFNHYQTLHKNWIFETRSFIRDKVPDFDQIDDKDSYDDVYRSLMKAWGEVPKSTELILVENDIVRLFSSISSLIETHQGIVREMSESIELATYRNFTNDNIIRIFKDTDDRNRVFHYEISRIREATKLARIVRSDFIFKVIYAWLEIARAKLHVVNIEDLADIVVEINNILNSPDIYAAIKSRTSKGKADLEGIRSNLAPISANQLLIGEFDFIDKIGFAITNISLSRSMRDEIDALLIDYKSATQSRKAQIDEMMASLDRYHRERIRWTRAVSRRKQDTATNECKQIARDIISRTEPNLESELLFLKYKGEC